jgi:hypothetical protein
MEQNTKVILTIPSLSQIGELKGLKEKYKTSVGYRKEEEWHALKNVAIRAYFLGLKEIPNDDGELINCAVFAAEDGIFLAAQMVLVDSVRRYEPGTAFQITFLDKKTNKSSKGSTNIFEVILLEKESE